MAHKSKISTSKRNRREELKSRRAALKAALPPTEVSVTFRHIEPTPALHDYARRKLGHLAKFVKRPAEAHLILTVDKYRQHGEVTVKSGRMTVTAQEETKDLYSVIDLLAAKVERQLKKHLEKIEARKVRGPSTGELLSAAEQAPPLPPTGRPVQGY